MGITSSSQAVTDTLLYDGFGMTVSRTGTTPTPFGFVGKGQYQTDNDSGLQLLGNRCYNASVGRFISSDPAQAGDNWFAYCENNPLNRTDPEGLDDILSEITNALARPLTPQEVGVSGGITIIGGIVGGLIGGAGGAAGGTVVCAGPGTVAGAAIGVEGGAALGGAGEMAAGGIVITAGRIIGAIGHYIGGGGNRGGGSPPANSSPPGAGRRGAFGKAKQDLGIPQGEQPVEGPNIGNDGSMQPGRVYRFKNGKFIRDDILTFRLSFRLSCRPFCS